MLRVTGTAPSGLYKILLTPKTSATTQLTNLSGTVIIASGAYDFYLDLGIYDFQLYYTNNDPVIRNGIQVLSTDTLITLEGLLGRL